MRTLFCFLLIATSLCAFEKHKKPTHPPPSPEHALLAPARSAAYPAKDARGAPYASASGILWQSKLWGLEFAAKDFVPANVTSSLATFDEKLFIPDFAWQPGFKVDFGYQLPKDGWDLNSQWTYYHGEFTDLKKDFDSQTAPQGIGIIPLWYYPFQDVLSSPPVPVRYARAHAGWKLNFNAIDLDLGRLFFVSRSLPLRITIGAKGNWINQTYTAHYRGGLIEDVLIPDVDTSLNSLFSYQQQSWGLGPRTSFQSKWPIGMGFSLIGNGAFSLLYSTFHSVTRFNNTQLSSSGPVSFSLRRKETLRLLAPALEAQLGFDWGMSFGTINPWSLDLLLSYEWQYFWSQNHARRNYSSISQGATFDSRGDLQMHGLTTTIRCDF